MHKLLKHAWGQTCRIFLLKRELLNIYPGSGLTQRPTTYGASILSILKYFSGTRRKVFQIARTYTIVFVVLCVVGLCHTVKYVDLTHTHDGHALTWANNPPFNSTILWRGIYYGNVWMELNYICTPEHMGTHLDAPSHFSKTGWRLHQVPIDKLMGPGVVVDVKSEAAKNRDYAVTVDDLLKWESKYGRIPDKAVVIMNSGWDKYWGNVNLAFGTDMFNDTMSYHFPGWHVDTVQWLISNRNINILGVDTPSTDPAQEHKYPVHVLATAHNIVMIESVANLDDIPASGAMIYAPAAKYYQGSGAPVRVFASVNDNVSSSNKAQTNILIILLIVIPMTLESITCFEM